MIPNEVTVDIFQVEIIQPGAKRLLDEMAEMELISIAPLDLDRGSEDRRAEIISLAGTWQEMSEDDFKEYLTEAKRSGREMFGREVQL